MKLGELWKELKTVIKNEPNVRDFLQKVEKLNTLTSSDKNKNLVSQESITVHFHIFHKSYLRKLSVAVYNFPNSQILISVPDIAMENLVTRKLEKLSKVQEIRISVVENEGRNFGPLIKIFSESILEREFLIHVHSKASRGSIFRWMWAHILWRKLVLEKESIIRNIELFSRKESGILFPFSVRWMPHYFSWYGNYELAEKYFPEIAETYSPTTQFLYPIGGMFMARVASIRPLLLSDDLKSAFIPESQNKLGMKNGITAEHMVERALGLIPVVRGTESVVVLAETDTSFNSAELLERLAKQSEF
jgi:hypothetical protein